ncbi:MAG: App1 family protein [Planctomycetota bacterium]|nr:App1 family protein [Planctomycetota bacterium]
MQKRIASRTDVEPSDHVVVYPTIGNMVDGGESWRIDIYGTVYEAGSESRQKRMLLRLLQRAAGVQPTEEEHELFEPRVREFIAPTERGKQVALRVGDRVHYLQHRTKRNGRFGGTVRLSAHELAELRASGDLSAGVLKLHILSRDGSESKFFVHAHLLHDVGTSVVSDIDDTIKVSNVHSRRLLLEGTFLRKFESIDGMSTLYSQWADQGAAFHYVSSSPWQLYTPLAQMCDAGGFPWGSFHLRSFRLRDHMLRRLLLIRRKGKAKVIHTLLKTFPRRRFVLVGDSGETDAEMYGRLARKCPGQVAAIYIRLLDERPLHDERAAKAFHGLLETSIQTFRCPSELPDDLIHVASADSLLVGS